MSWGGANNFTPPPPPGPWWPGHVYGAYPPNNDDWNYSQPVFSRFVPPYGATPNGIGRHEEVWLLQERIVTGPSGLARIPPRPPMPIIPLNNGMPRSFIPEPQPRPTNQWNMPQVPPTREESQLTQDEQKKALNKLKKEIYNPTPKRIIQRMNLYYKEKSAGVRSSDKRKEVDDDEKRCAICLDDFEPRQEVMVTPCDHMFHEECIVPWVKSHGQCPVCRFVISERVRQSAVTSNGNGVNVVGGDPSVGELVSIIRAMEVALGRRTIAFH